MQRRWARKIPVRDYWLYVYWTCFVGGVVYIGNLEFHDSRSLTLCAGVEYYRHDPEERAKALAPVPKPKAHSIRFIYRLSSTAGSGRGAQGYDVVLRQSSRQVAGDGQGMSSTFLAHTTWNGVCFVDGMRRLVTESTTTIKVVFAYPNRFDSAGATRQRAALRR